MDIINAMHPTLIGMFFVCLAVVQYRWGAKQLDSYPLNFAFVIFSAIYGIVILYGVVM